MAGTEESTPVLAEPNITVIHLYNITYMLCNTTYLSIYLSMYLSIHLSIYLSIYPSDDSTHQRTLQETPTPQARDLTGTLVSSPLMLKHKTVVYFPLSH